MAAVSLLTSGQRQFSSVLARETGLDPRVIGSWLLAEESSSAAAGYQSRGYHNWLNIAMTDSGPAGGAHSSVWGNPTSAAKATAEWLKGGGQITHEYGKAAPGIRGILSTAGKGAQAQINAIAGSGWASSGYNGGSSLRSLFSQLGGEKLAPASGSPGQGAPVGQAVPGQLSVSGGPSAGSGETQQLLAQALAAMQPKPQPLAIGSPARPASAAGPILPNGSHPPAPLTPVPVQDTSAQQLLEAALSSAGQGGEEAHVTSTPGKPAAYAPAAAAVHAGGPLAGLLPKGAMLKLGRIDAGQDGQTNPGGAIIANGNGEIVDVKSDPSGFGPRYPVVVFHSGPLAGHGPIYLGHTLAALGKGAQFHQGTVLSRTGTSGVGNATTPGWFEIGYASALGQGDRGQGRAIAPLLSRPM